jgi:hypothetical protein
MTRATSTPSFCRRGVWRDNITVTFTKMKMNAGRHLDAVRMPRWSAFLPNWLIVLCPLSCTNSALFIFVCWYSYYVHFGSVRTWNHRTVIERSEDVFQRGCVIAGEMNIYMGCHRIMVSSFLIWEFENSKKKVWKYVKMWCCMVLTKFIVVPPYWNHNKSTNIMLHVSDNLSNSVPMSCLCIISDPLRVRSEVGGTVLACSYNRPELLLLIIQHLRKTACRQGE